jgi:hypothetical protein
MGLRIDGIAASSAIDTSSEAIDIENLDISSLKSGQGVLNYEHRNPKQQGASFLDVLGAITYAHKIMGPDDCENDRQRSYWDQVQLPFVYIQAELFDDENHPGAVAAASIIRFYHTRKMPILIRFSIDGHTIEREGNVLKHCIARDVALTIKPANHSCVSGVLDEKAKKVGALDELSRSQDGLTRLPGVEFTMLAPDDDIDPVTLIRSEVANLQELGKAMTAGSMMAAPGDLRGGSALAKEDVQGGLKMRLTTAFRDWTRKSTLHDHLIKTLPDIHPDFLHKFVELITENRLRKASELHEYLEKTMDAGSTPPKTASGTAIDAPPDADKTKAFGKPGDAAPAPIQDAQTPPPAAKGSAHVMKPGAKRVVDMTPEERQGIYNKVNAEAAANPASQAAAAKASSEVAEIQGAPHVAGLRVGVHPEHAPAMDRAAQMRAINAEAARNSADAAAAQANRPSTPGLLAKRADEDEDPDAIEAEDPTKPLTIRGKPVSPNPKKRSASFDENTGILHTSRGSFPMYIPSHDSPAALHHFMKTLSDPKVTEFHDYAVRQWARLNERIKTGDLPPAVIMHATLFSQLSPNTPVPMQELMYGHLVDHMNEVGVDARHPAFGSEYHRDQWKARDQKQQLPQNSPEHWERMRSQIRLAGDSEAKFNAEGQQVKEARQAGDLKSFMLANNKWKNMAQYHTIHDRLVGLIASNKDDVRKSVRELMFQKSRGDGGVPGLAPKTARYMMGMLGGGNVMVPDTHFVRYLFGLDKKQDSATIGHLKSVLWRDTMAGSDTLEGIDRYYFRHHDAVKHMLEHPEHGKLFRDNPESAIFPAFWKNWVSIVPHEKFRGLTTGGQNEFTDHRPFWEAIAPFLKAEGETVDPRWELAAKTAIQHIQWAEEHGEAQAMMLYYAHLLPHLMGAGLRKDEAAFGPGQGAIDFMPPKPAEVIKVRGKPVHPGELRYRPDVNHAFAGAKFKVVSASPDHYEVLHGSGPSARLAKVPRALEGKAFEVTRHPLPAAIPDVLSKDHLSSSSHHPDQLALASRIDFTHAKKHIMGDTHAARGQPPWYQGEPKVFIKPSSSYTGKTYQLVPDAAIAETAFHNAARDVFGLGHVVPTTITFWHPHDGKLHSAQDFVQGGRHADTGPHLQAWHDQGIAPRMAVMDHVLGNDDRWSGNFMLAPDGSPRLIDNGFAFGYHGKHSRPEYVHQDFAYQPFQPDVHQWIAGLNPQVLEKTLGAAGVPDEHIQHAVRRLGNLQRSVALGTPVGYRHLETE